MTFGIPSSALPVSVDGKIKTDFHLERIKKRIRQEKESTLDSKDLVVTPGPFDILLGRGKLSQENLGNLRYRNLIACYQDTYETARKIEKTKIADEVVQSIKKCSGRFLKEHYADFVEISDVKAREKVAHSFRSLRNNQLIKKKTTEGNSSDESTGEGKASTIIGGRSEGLSKLGFLQSCEEQDAPVSKKRSKAA
jgi:PBP1b-binding outer membrane lipoprotein LpoB